MSPPASSQEKGPLPEPAEGSLTILDLIYEAATVTSKFEQLESVDISNIEQDILDLTLQLLEHGEGEVQEELKEQLLQKVTELRSKIADIEKQTPSLGERLKRMLQAWRRPESDRERDNPVESFLQKIDELKETRRRLEAEKEALAQQLEKRREEAEAEREENQAKEAEEQKHEQFLEKQRELLAEQRGKIRAIREVTAEIEKNVQELNEAFEQETRELEEQAAAELRAEEEAQRREIERRHHREDLESEYAKKREAVQKEAEEYDNRLEHERRVQELRRREAVQNLGKLSELMTGLVELEGELVSTELLERPPVLSPDQLFFTYIFAGYLRHIQKNFRFNKTFQELTRDFLNSVGAVRIPYALLFAQEVVRALESYGEARGTFFWHKNAVDSLLKKLNSEVLSVIYLAEEAQVLAARAQAAATEMKEELRLLKLLAKKGTITIRKAVDPFGKNQNYHFQEQALVVAGFVNKLLILGTWNVTDRIYKQLDLNNWTTRAIDEYFAQFQKDGHVLVLSELFIKLDMNPQFIFLAAKSSYQEIENIVLNNSFSIPQEQTLLDRLFMILRREPREDRQSSQVPSEVSSARSGAEVIQIVIGRLKTFGTITSRFILFMRQQFNELGERVLTKTFNEYVRDFYAELSQQELNRGLLGELTKGFPRMSEIIFSIKIIFFRQLWRALNTSSGLTPAEIKMEVQQLLADEDFRSNLRDLLFERRTFLRLLSSHRPNLLGFLDIDRNPLLRRYFYRVPDAVRRAASFDEVADILAQTLAQKRQVERQGASPRERLKRSEFYWMFWAFKNEDEVQELNQHGWYPRMFNKEDLPRYEEGKEKDVAFLLANSKEKEGHVAGNFLGAAGVTPPETVFEEVVANPGNWGDHPVVALGVAIAHRKDRDKQGDEYRRVNPYNLHWKWAYRRVVSEEAVEEAQAQQATAEREANQTERAAEAAEETVSPNQALNWVGEEEYEKILEFLKRVKELEENNEQMKNMLVYLLNGRSVQDLPRTMIHPSKMDDLISVVESFSNIDSRLTTHLALWIPYFIVFHKKAEENEEEARQLLNEILPGEINLQTLTRENVNRTLASFDGRTLQQVLRKISELLKILVKKEHEESVPQLEFNR